MVKGKTAVHTFMYALPFIFGIVTSVFRTEVRLNAAKKYNA